MEFRQVIGWEAETGQVLSDITQRLLAWMRHAQLDSHSDVTTTARTIATGFCDLMSASGAMVFARQLAEHTLLPMAAVRSQQPYIQQSAGQTAGSSRDSDSVSDFTTTLNPTLPQDVARYSLSSWPTRYEDFSDVFDEISIALAPSVKSDPDEEAPLTDGIPNALPLDALPTAPFFVAGSAPHWQVFFGEWSDFLNNRASASDELGSSLANWPPALAIPLLGTENGDVDQIVGLVLLWLESENGLLSATLRPVIEAASAQAGHWLNGALRSERLGRSYQELAALCANAIDGRDTARAGHSGAVARYAGLTARALGWTESQIEQVEFAGLLHNIGKATVPDAVLLKEGKLSTAEMEIVRASTGTAASWIEQIDGMQEIAIMVRHQAERWDGDGYPDGLQGTAIPPGSRILAVALRFAAMTKPRSGRRPMSVVRGAFDRLQKDSGQALDPAIVEAFFKAMGRPIV